MSERTREHVSEPELRQDLEYERDSLDDSIRHDYSTSDTGIVPLDRRRPIWHFAGLWTTFAAGFSFLFLGFELHDGHSLGGVLGITVLGVALYVAYATVAAYLGSRTGQTHGLLSRSIFGAGGSGLVSLFVLIAPLGWVGFQAGLLAQIWSGLYGWGHLELLTIVLAAVMILNNLLGFTGISVFARYLVTPLIVLWIAYLVIKGFSVDHEHLRGVAKGSGISFWAAVGATIGFTMWGNEPDVFRYGRPRFSSPIPSFSFAYVWFVLFVLGGWMVAQLAGTTDTGAAVRYATDYSLFGFAWLAFLLATISQFAINDGNYYESVNAGQNLIGAWKHWRRPYTCIVIAGGGALAGYLVNFRYLDGWFKVAGFLAVTVPSATVIMAADHFLVPRMFGIRRSLLRVPSWRESGRVNIPAVIALLVAVVYGVYAGQVWDFGLSRGYAHAYHGPVPLFAWLIAGVVYLAGVAVVRLLAPNPRAALGFSRQALEESPDAANAPRDIATAAGV